MATDLEHKVPSTKYQGFIDQQIARVRRRIRMFDVGSALLMFVVAVLGYALLMALLDRTFELPLAVRFVGLVLGALVAGFFLVLTTVRLGRRISSHYAARELERTVPDAKNSVINWLDLRDEELPPVIRTALSHKAAKDLKRSDADQAVSGNWQWLLTGAAVAIVFGLLIMLFMGPAQFMSLMARAFAPFREITIATRTSINLIEPEGGDANVPLNQRVDIRVQITGSVAGVNKPGAPQLHFRYDEKDEPVLMPLQQDLDGIWAKTIQPDQVQNGFLYRITAGDATSKEHRVTVFTIPQVLSWQFTHKYRDYRRLPEITFVYPNKEGGLPEIRGHHGTEVTLITRTNRVLKDAELQLQFANAHQSIVGEIVPNDEKAKQFKLTIEQNGKFQAHFTSKDGKKFDSGEYQIYAIDDTAPVVKLTKPAVDVKLPANGTLSLEGQGRDDFGIKKLVLQMRVVGDRVELKPKAYRPGKSFEFGNGTYPDSLEYKDVVALEKLQTSAGKAVPLAKGMVLEYWLEATDNFDYPSNNLGKSEAFKVFILDPEKDQQKQQQERQQAEKTRQDHKQEQDKKWNAENDKRTPPQDPDLKKKEDELRDKMNKLEKELEKENKQQKQEEKERGQAKPNPDENSGGKPEEKKSDTKEGDSSADAEAGKSKDAKGTQEPQAGQNKEGGMNEGDSGQAKDGGQKQEGKQNDNSQAQNQPQPGTQGQAKDGGQNDPKSGQQQGGAKDGGDEKANANPKGSAEKNQPSANSKSGDKNSGAAKSGPGESQKQPANAREGDTKKEDVADGKEANEGQTPKDGGNAKSAGQKESPNAASKDQVGKAEPKSGAKDGGGQETATAKNEQGKGSSESTSPQQGTQNQSTPAQAKGQRAPGAEKGPGGNQGMGDQPKATAKDDRSKSQDGHGATKQPTPEQAERSEARGDTPIAEPKEATAEDVARLEKELNGSPEQRRKAEEELRRILEQAQDKDVREQAGDKLHEKNLAPAKAKGNQGQADPQLQGQQKNQDPKMKEPEKQGDARGEGQSEDGKKPEPASGKSGKEQDVKDPQFHEGSTKGGNRAGHFGPGGEGIDDEPTGAAPNAEFGRRAGDLNLDHLKKKINDDVLRKAGMTPDQWQQFQREVEDYGKLLRKHQANAEKLTPGQGVSKLSSRPLQQINSAPNAEADPTQIRSTSAPPEFRESQRVFTSKQK